LAALAPLLVAVLGAYPAFAAPPTRVALACAGGGASANLIDRLHNGTVTDFIDLRVWPVFNLADVAIVAGVIVAALTARWSALA
jgi:signal peptidase II